MKRILIFGVVCLLLLGALVFVFGPTLLFGVTMAQEEILTAIVCESVVVSPESEGMINPNSLSSTEDGHLLYLIRERENPLAELIHVAPDGSIDNFGMIPMIEGVYGFPTWVVDSERNQLFFQTMTMDGEAVNLAVERLDYLTGEREVMMTNVAEFRFGRVGHLIWWASNAGGTYFHNPATDVTSEILPQSDGTSARYMYPMKLIGETDVLLSEYSEEGERYNRLNLTSGQILQLHEDAINETISNSLVLEDSILYINHEGVLKEIDFEGNVLRNIPLQGEGRYYNLTSMDSGVLYSYHRFENFNLVSNSVYYVAADGAIHQLIPDGLNFLGWPASMAVTNASGGEQIWFSTDHPSENDKGTLYGFSVSEEGISQTFHMEEIGGFELSPNQQYIIANNNRTGLLISPESLSTVGTIGDYYGIRKFSSSEDQLFYSEGNQLFVYDIAQNQREVLVTGQEGEPTVYALDEENDFVYFYETVGRDTESLGNRVLYVSSVTEGSAVAVALPEVTVAFDIHASGFRLTEANDVVYVDEDWQTLYRASCQRGSS